MTVTMYENEQKRSDTAYHEAGHAVIACRLALRIEGFSIVPTWEGLGSFKVEEGRADCKTDFQHVACDIGGWCSELWHNRRASPSGSREDDDKVQKLLARLNAKCNVAVSLEWIRKETDDLVAHYWKEIEAVATAVLEEDTLCGEEIETICNLVNAGRNWRQCLCDARRVRDLATDGGGTGY
jgi:hypothetical protein